MQYQKSLASTLKFCCFLLLLGTETQAKLETYKIDPSHTYPSFEADHMGGLSLWRGKINSSTGEITIDTELNTGRVKVVMDMSTIDFGHQKMNAHAKRDDMFAVEEYPNAIFEGELVEFVNEAPTKVKGQLTLRGVTQPLTLAIKTAKCMLHPFKLKQVCGATAEGTIMRDDFGIDNAKFMGFDMEVRLLISVEAIKVRNNASK